MQLGQQIKMRQSQSLVMTPQLQQAIKLLQMTNLELCQYLENQQAENPFLEIDTNTQESKDEDYQAKDTTSNLSDDMQSGKSISDDPSNNQDYENRYETELNERPKLDSPSPISKNTSTEDFDDYISNLASRPETLKEHVRKQISLELKESKDLLIASVLTDYLEPTGWLSTDIEDIANEINCHVDEINSVLVKLQKLEPAGVFARNLSECLKIQLEEKSLLSEGIEILLDNLDLLAKGELRQLIKMTNFTQEEISKSITLIRSLNPKPGEMFLIDETIQNSPDVIVSKGSNGWVVELNKSTLPAVVIDENYISKMSSKKQDSNSSSYVADTIASARWLKRSVEQRNSTTLTIASAIIAQQEDFLKNGLSHLKPMVLRDIASNVGMHESTVSRVTTGLTIETPRGCFAMKYFFSVSLNSAENGETHAATAVREAIKKLISEEPSKKPLSDEAIAIIMKKDGIDLARRTVAKYREIMKIPSSAQRRRQTILEEIS